MKKTDKVDLCALHKKPIAVACSIITLMAASAHAQQTRPTGAGGSVPSAGNAGTGASGGEVTEVVVTGIRKGIEDAISVKASSDLVVEAISAEDIGKLPDSSIAESIARLPGITAQRVAGRAQEISVRGMSGDFASTLMNGREQVSTGDNRSAQFDQYPSELVSAVVVYKTPDATLVGQGLAGTINLQTVRPLSFTTRQFAVNVRRQKDNVGSVGDGKGTRFSTFYIDQFANQTLGLSVGYARYQDTGDATIRNGDYSNMTVNGATVSVPTHLKDFSNHKNESRDGFVGTLQWQPSDVYSSVLDVYYSKFNAPTVRNGIEVTTTGTWTGGCQPACALLNPVIGSNGKVDSGTWTNTHAVVANDKDLSSAKLKAAGWSNSWKPADDWAIDTDLSYSQAQRNESPYETWAGAPTTLGDTASFSNGAAGLANLVWKPSLNYTDPKIIKLMDAGGWGFDGYLKKLEVDDRLKSVRLGAERTLPDGWGFSRLQFGANYSDRYKRRAVPEYQLHLVGGEGQSIPSPGSDVAGDSGIPIISYNSLGVASLYNFVPNTYYDINLKEWEVFEKNLTAYTKLDIQSHLWSMPLRGNVGVQFVRIDQSSRGNTIDSASGTGDSNRTVTKLTAGAKYSDVLPSLNLAGDLGHEQTLRLALARVSARPRMDELSNSGTYYVDLKDPRGYPIWKGSGGNPKLRPFLADALDLSYEKYFGTKAYVAVAGFYKKLDSYIYSYTNGNFDFTGRPNSLAITPPSNIGEFTEPQNGHGGKIEGFELSASLPLDLLTRYLKGFGVVASYANTSSSIKPFGSNDTQPLPGLSRQTSNITVYYEDYGFSARVSQRYRSDFLGEIIGYASNRYFQYIRGERIIDMQVGYEIQHGAAKGLSVLLQVDNVGNEKYREYKDTPDNITNSTEYGATVLLGLNYRM